MVWGPFPQGQAALADLPHLSMLSPDLAILDLALLRVAVILPPLHLEVFGGTAP